jgi:hypothetical protein
MTKTLISTDTKILAILVSAKKLPITKRCSIPKLIPIFPLLSKEKGQTYIWPGTLRHLLKGLRERAE